GNGEGFEFFIGGEMIGGADVFFEGIGRGMNRKRREQASGNYDEGRADGQIHDSSDKVRGRAGILTRRGRSSQSTIARKRYVGKEVTLRIVLALSLSIRVADVRGM